MLISFFNFFPLKMHLSAFQKKLFRFFFFLKQNEVFFKVSSNYFLLFGGWTVILFKYESSCVLWKLYAVA